MVYFPIIGFLLLALIYFALKNQGLQKEIKICKHSLKASDNQARYALKTLVSVSSELQKTYLSRLETANKKGLLSSEDYEAASFILRHTDYVIMRCVEHGATVEEAVNKALEPTALTIKDINQYIAKQASEIRVPWCKNSVGGFITASHNISLGSLTTKAADSEVATKEASAS